MFFSPNLAVWLGAMGLNQAGELSPIVTDRPDFTESSLVVPLRTTQIESGFTYERTRRRAESLGIPEILVRHSLSERLELRLGLPNYSRLSFDGESIEGLGDTYLGAKIQLGPTRDGTELALIPAVFVPTGRRGIRSESMSPEIKFVFSRDLGEGYALSGMLYVASIEEGGSRVEPWQQTLSLGIPIRDRVGMFVEQVLEFQRGERPAHKLHSGFTFQPRPHTQFDVHYGAGLTPNAPNFFIGAGFSIRF